MEDVWNALVALIAGFYTFLERDLWVTPWRLGRSLHALYQVHYSWDDGAYYAYAPIPWWHEVALWPLLRLADKRPLRRLNMTGRASADLAWRELKWHATLRGDVRGAAYAAGRQALYLDEAPVATVATPRALPGVTLAPTYGVTMAQAAEGLARIVAMMNHPTPPEQP